MTGPYVFRDPVGDYLLASTAQDGDGVEIAVVEAKTGTRVMITIPAGRLSDLMTGLYQQAGRPVPVMINPAEVAEDWVRIVPPGGDAA